MLLALFDKKEQRLFESGEENWLPALASFRPGLRSWERALQPPGRGRMNKAELLKTHLVCMRIQKSAGASHFATGPDAFKGPCSTLRLTEKQRSQKLGMTWECPSELCLPLIFIHSVTFFGLSSGHASFATASAGFRGHVLVTFPSAHAALLTPFVFPALAFCDPFREKHPSANLPPTFRGCSPTRILQD